MAMRRIAEQAERAGQVIRSVHDFVRRRDRTRESVTPQALVDAILPLVRLQARKLGVRVELAVEDRLPAVLCDRTLVEQVLLNLARNGMQAMDMPELSERVLRLRVVRASGSRGPGRRQLARVLGRRSRLRHQPTRWRRACSRPSSPPSPKAWAWA